MKTDLIRLLSLLDMVSRSYKLSMEDLASMLSGYSKT
jgi:hypothetical protein